MPLLEIDIPVSLKKALDKHATQKNEPTDQIINNALAQYLELPLHTLFQVSTSGALVAGVYSGMVAVDTLLQHGDFGLGTFASLDGEMAVMEGKVYQIRGNGKVTIAPDDALAPFAVVTRFKPQKDLTIGQVQSLSQLEEMCDAHSPSENLFYAFRIDGHFAQVHTRVVNPPSKGTRLADAAKSQTEFRFCNIEGSLIGIWSPSFSSAFSVPGHHFHFLSADRQHGGHLLDCASFGPLRLQMEELNDFHLALPETQEFLTADLSKDSSAELAYAEKSH
ncbi:acetolactate decarboxylase [Pseudomonas sp. PP3]|mgnify:CR=1 FL=1|uniref:acetolactate decarboxylase n=1 Tax=Pseudomonas sp. PP3 TaxID=2815936 RepID=UPI001BB07502|nr:acetolactate decarboxylase [Pseudomonas sp. PP3]